MRNGWALVLGIALLAGCSEEKAPESGGTRIAPMAPAAAATDAGALVPTDAACVVRFASSGTLETLALRIATDMGIPLPPDPAAALAGMVGLEAAALDRDRPLYLCVSLPGGAAPVLTLLAPVADAAAVSRAHPEAAVSGGYVSLSAGPPPAAGGSALPARLVGGDLSARIDVARLTAAYRSGIEAFFDEFRMDFAQGVQMGAPGVDFGPMLDDMVDWMRRVVESTDAVDVTLHERDGLFDLQAALHVREGTALAAGAGEKPRLQDLARRLPGGMPLTLLLRLDMPGMMDMFLPMASGMAQRLPPEKRAAMDAAMKRSAEITRMLGDEWALGAGFSKGGMRMGMVGRAKDAKGYVDAYCEHAVDPALQGAGMAFRAGETREIAGTTVRRLHMGFDLDAYQEFTGQGAPDASSKQAMETMFGKDGMGLDLAAKDDLVYMAVGAVGDTMADLLAGQGPPAWFNETAKTIPGDLLFLARIEMRGLSRGMAEMMRDILPGGGLSVGAGPAVPILLWGSREGPVYRAGLAMNVGKIKAVFKSR